MSDSGDPPDFDDPQLDNTGLAALIRSIDGLRGDIGGVRTRLEKDIGKITERLAEIERNFEPIDKMRRDLESLQRKVERHEDDRVDLATLVDSGSARGHQASTPFLSTPPGQYGLELTGDRAERGSRRKKALYSSG